nr:immunoglobulin light chain junction region [Macaca mulatta]MOW15942.1 immunoglobulin light chain junction region [Macaca mulatta]MOW16648.1 immunoglobulin light chain junction region [Macaca mulatta]MOW16675.1 immunoglobulin light chain junction region [Macaca mulatta]
DYYCWLHFSGVVLF